MSKSRHKKGKHSADAHKGGGKTSSQTQATASTVETAADETVHEQVFSTNDANEADALMAEFAAGDAGNAHAAWPETIDASADETSAMKAEATASDATAQAAEKDAVLEPSPRDEHLGKRRGKLALSASSGKPVSSVKLVVPTDPRAPAFAQLGEYERLSLAHIAGTPQQSDAPGHWRGVGFRLGTRRLAASFDEVVEILSMPQITHVPGAQPWMLGVANVRGTLLPVVDLKQFLEGERTVIHEAQRILVVRQTGGNVAVLIDELFGQRSFNDSQTVKVDDEEGRYGYFVKQVYRVGDFDWGVFSMSMLARTPEFRQAAA